MYTNVDSPRSLVTGSYTQVAINDCRDNYARSKSNGNTRIGKIPNLGGGGAKIEDI